MLKFSQFIDLSESDKEGQRALHWKLGKGKRGKTRPPAVRRKISRAMAGKSNFEGQSHTEPAKEKIKDARGHDDRVDGKKWIENKSTGQTFRRRQKPDNFRWGR